MIVMLCDVCLRGIKRWRLDGEKCRVWEQANEVIN